MILFCVFVVLYVAIIYTLIHKGMQSRLAAARRDESPNTAKSNTLTGPVKTQFVDRREPLILDSEDDDELPDIDEAGHETPQEDKMPDTGVEGKVGDIEGKDHETPEDKVPDNDDDEKEREIPDEGKR